MLLVGAKKNMPTKKDWWPTGFKLKNIGIKVNTEPSSHPCPGAPHKLHSGSSPRRGAPGILFQPMGLRLPPQELQSQPHRHFH